MPNGDVQCSDVYRRIVEKLHDIGAADLAKKIQQTIARGVVETLPSNHSKSLRDMNDQEKVAVALEHMMTAI